MPAVEVIDPRFRPVALGAGPLERLATGAVWSEGPVWLAESGEVLWSDIPNNRMLAWHPRHGHRVWREACEFTNGHVREWGGPDERGADSPQGARHAADGGGPRGALLHCSHGRRAIVRTRLDAHGQPVGDDEIVVDRYQRRRLNSPNDLVVKRDGTIWFTDPPYGILSDREGHQAESELGDCYVFRFDPTTAGAGGEGALRIVSDFVEEPNGLAFSPDERVLYVSDTSAALRTEGSGHHHIVAFDVVGGQDLANPRVFAVVNPGLADGFRVDVHGFVYTSSEDSVQVYHPDGTRIGHIPVPEKVGNLVFGGQAGNELFICASSSLYRIVLATRGATA